MKKIILLFAMCIAIILASCAVQKPASGNRVYKPLKEFNKDTLAYLKYNFEEHADFYKGKPIATIVNDLEVRMRNYVPGFAHMNKSGQIFDCTLELGVFDKQVVYAELDLDQPILEKDVVKMLAETHKAYPDSLYTISPIKRNFYNKLQVKNIHVYNYEFKKK
jgi:hypothetical protein